ncbi:hypothetical protein QTP88_019746 [Uroleucon formosanum]
MEFNKPDSLKMTGNLAENFKNFEQQLQIYFDATEIHTKKEATQVAILLNLLGSDGLKMYNTLKIPIKTVFVILKTLEAYCIPKRNETMELYKFFTRKQLDVNRKLIQEDTKTLFNIEAEQNKGSKQFSGGVKSNFRKPTQHKQSNGKSDGKVNNNCNCKASVQSNFKEKNVKCVNDCTRNKCRKGEISYLKIQGQINNIETDNMCLSIDAFEIMNTENNVINNNKFWIEKIRINGMETKIKLDTGAELKVISVEMIKKMKDIQLCESNITIKSFGGYITKFIGKVTLELENNKIKLYRLFEVVEYEGLPLLNYEACVSMQYNMNQSKYP